MLINILLLIVIFLCLISITVIISRKFLSLININLEKIPTEKAAKIKRDLLERRFIRQIEELKNKLKENQKNLKEFFKAEINFIRETNKKVGPKVKTGLIFLKNKVQLIKNKILPR